MLQPSPGEPHAVCENVVVFAPAHFIVPARPEVRRPTFEEPIALRSGGEIVTLVSLSAFGCGAIGMVVAFVLLVGRIAM